MRSAKIYGLLPEADGAKRGLLAVKTKGLFLLIPAWGAILLLLACAPAPPPTPAAVKEIPSTPVPVAEVSPTPAPAMEEEAAPPPSARETEKDEFDTWWEEYKKPVVSDSSSYPDFLRGVWGSRVDELRSYLINGAKLRNAGCDSVLLGVDIVFDPETGEAKSLGDDVFIFYLQAFKKAGFRVILIPNPMHPNLDMGKGYEWERPDPDAGYHRGCELIEKLDSVVVKWAKIAEEYKVDGFAPANEPFKLVWDYNDASQWLQKILPEIRQVYSGRVVAIDTMLSLGQGRDIPFPYDYSGYDMLSGGPPSGRKYIADWEEMIEGYIGKGNEYVETYNLEGFGLYEWGGYTGGVWYEPIPEEQLLSQEQARQIVATLVRQAEGEVIASFPRISIGWIDFDTPAFEVLQDWYSSMGSTAVPLDDKEWTYEELINIEKRLAGSDYKDIFQIEDVP